jgi:general L-amino acid transport system substrate-binding protein
MRPRLPARSRPQLPTRLTIWCCRRPSRKEPLGPFTRNGDEVWSDIITWLHYGLIEAEELGVTQANADEQAKSQVPAVQRLLGASGDLGSRLTLDNKWMLAAIKAGGNYSEIFERNVGKASPLKLDRGLNGTWNKGGLMYAIRSS